MKALRIYPHPTYELLSDEEVLVQLVCEAVLEGIQKIGYDWPSVETYAKEVVFKNEQNAPYKQNQLLYNLIIEPTQTEDKITLKIEIYTRANSVTTANLEINSVPRSLVK